MNRFPAKGLERLAKQVVAGRVVFFIGAGFSLDSEKNFATRLIARLLARFLAFCECFTGGGQETARGLFDGLVNTFGLERDDTARHPYMTWENVKKLSAEYYHINDWMCGAYNALLGEVKSLRRKKAFVEKLNKRENMLLGELRSDPEPLEKLDYKKVLRLKPPDRGKALFLDTMGFDNTNIMCGDPMGPDIPGVVDSYKNRLKNRHFVLARFAREGFCPTLLTTNYDLLLEGAYRLAGFVHREPENNQIQGKGSPDASLLPTTHQYFSRITEATQFFDRGEGHHSALLVKIHGCVENYRQAKSGSGSGTSPSSVRDWEAYLPTMVFTYREIQNWRRDFWSRDYLRTVLRTRTMVFCGYSAMDPVLHDTFRTVYEEMASRRKTNTSAGGGMGAGNPSSMDVTNAPAYFLGLADSTEFHGMEIMRAASQAVGEANPDLTNHPNYLRFFISPGDFPTLDEMMSWLFHRVFRRCQKRCMKRDLRRIAAMLLGHPCPEDELEEINRNYRRLFEEEQTQANSWSKGQEARDEFERVVGWTERFQAGLLKEFALGEWVLRNKGFGVDLQGLRKRPWYYPAAERPDWTAWAGVLELALRRMAASWQGRAADWMKDSPWTRVGNCDHPSIRFSRSEETPTPACLNILLSGVGEGYFCLAVNGAFRRRPHAWPLRPDAVPWWSDAVSAGRSTGRPPGVPRADEIWRWASGVENQRDRDRLETILGVGLAFA